MSLVLKQVENAAGVITFNHDSKRNALSRALIDELISTLDEIRAAGARSVILRTSRHDRLVSRPRRRRAAGARPRSTGL